MNFIEKITLRLCLLAALGSSVWITSFAHSEEPEDRQSPPTYDQLSPEELAKAMPKPEKIEAQLVGEIDQIRQKRYASLDRLQQIDKELRRLDEIEQAGPKKLFDALTKKKGSYRDYETGASPGKLQKEREALTAEKNSLDQKAAALFEKEQALESEWLDYVQIRKSDPILDTSAIEKKDLKKFFQKQIADFTKELSVEEEYLQGAKIWVKNYPESQTSLAAQQQRVDDLKAQLKEAKEGLRLLERKKDAASDTGIATKKETPPQHPKPSRKALTAEEIATWKKKGFSDIEIKTLYSGGIITDETGHIITGWPPTSSKRKLSFFDRFKKTSKPSK